jgi:hypothetical protein
MGRGLWARRKAELTLTIMLGVGMSLLIQGCLSDDTPFPENGTVDEKIAWDLWPLHEWK